MVGFDNAHSVPTAGSRHKVRPETADHWHRSCKRQRAPLSTFESADKLLADFFAEVHRVLAEHRISDEIRRVTEDTDDRS